MSTSEDATFLDRPSSLSADWPLPRLLEEQKRDNKSQSLDRAVLARHVQTVHVQSVRGTLGAFRPRRAEEGNFTLRPSPNAATGLLGALNGVPSGCPRRRLESGYRGCSGGVFQGVFVTVSKLPVTNTNLPRIRGRGRLRAGMLG